MSNDFLNELLALHPELAEEYESEQYKLSLEIIGLMTELGEESRKMAKIIGCSHNKYLRLESGDISVPVSEFKEAIFKIKVFKEQNSAQDEQTASDQQLVYGEFSFNISKAFEASTFEIAAIMETTVSYLNSKSTHTTESSIPPSRIKSYRDKNNFIGLKEVIQKNWSLTLNNAEEHSNSYGEYTYNY